MIYVIAKCFNRTTMVKNQSLLKIFTEIILTFIITQKTAI